MDWKALFLSPKGRIGPEDFWTASLALFVSGTILTQIPWIGPVLGVPLAYLCFCVAAKRLHDAGRPAWLVLIPVALILAAVAHGVLAINPSPDGVHTFGARAMARAAFLVMLISGLTLAVLGLAPADPGDNAYGSRRPQPAA